jgi:hypothetical protein
MKTLRKYFTIMLCLLATAFTMASCLNDDNDDTSSRPTEQQAQIYLSAMSGTYHSGKAIVVTSDENKEYADSADVSWTVTALDSMMYSQFPVKLLKNMIESDVQLQTALDSAETQDMNFKVIPESYSTDYYSFDCYPMKKLTFTLNYGNADHNIVVNFTNYEALDNSGYYSIGFYDPSSYKMLYYVLVYNISVDGTEIGIRNLPIKYYATKS